MNFFKWAFILALMLVFTYISNVSHASEVREKKGVGEVTKLSIPRFVTIKSMDANMRNGPGNRYPVSWRYMHKGYPVKIIDEYDNWRMAEDYEGNKGWFHASLLNSKRVVIVINNKLDTKLAIAQSLPSNQVLLFKKDDEMSFPVARIKLNSIGNLISCKKDWCYVEFMKTKGWMKKVNIWGVFDDEVFK